MAWFTSSPAGWLLVHRDQLLAQRSVTSMGKLSMGCVIWLVVVALETHGAVISNGTTKVYFLLWSYTHLHRNKPAQSQAENISLGNDSSLYRTARAVFRHTPFTVTLSACGLFIIHTNVKRSHLYKQLDGRTIAVVRPIHFTTCKLQITLNCEKMLKIQHTPHTTHRTQ